MLRCGLTAVYVQQQRQDTAAEKRGTRSWRGTTDICGLTRAGAIVGVGMEEERERDVDVEARGRGGGAAPDRYAHHSLEKKEETKERGYYVKKVCITITINIKVHYYCTIINVLRTNYRRL